MATVQLETHGHTHTPICTVHVHVHIQYHTPLFSKYSHETIIRKQGRRKFSNTGGGTINQLVN